MTLNPLVPELDVRIFAESLRFYREVLGFAVEYERIDPCFAMLSFEGAQLMISEITATSWYAPDSSTPLGRGMNLQIRTKDLDAVVARLNSNAYPIARGVYESSRESWGKQVLEREIHVFDPDGYILRFSELLD